MAQRLATEYVMTCLELTETDMTRFLDLIAVHQINPRVKVTENGVQEVSFQDDSGESVSLTFERRNGKFVCEGSCRFKNLKLANVMRKAVSQFKGDAIVNRIYPAFTMNYVYKRGAVVKISEITAKYKKLVYEYKDTVGQLERLFKQDDVEREIRLVQSRIDDLLDERNRSRAPEVHRALDEQLKRLTHRLFVLEA